MCNFREQLYACIGNLLDDSSLGFRKIEIFLMVEFKLIGQVFVSKDLLIL